MALTGKAPEPPSWGRWPPQPPNPEYLIMPIDTYQPDHRPGVPSQFMMVNVPGISPMSGMPVQHYESHNSFGFGSYATPSPSPPPVAPSFRSYQEEHLPPSPISTDNEGTHGSYQGDSRQHLMRQSVSPCVKPEPKVLAQKSSAPASHGRSKTISPVTTEKDSDQITFFTHIDVMMKAIQLQDEPRDHVEPEDAYSSPPHRSDSRCHSPDQTVPATKRNGKERPKRHVCPIGKCGKRFSQRTHLEIHQMVHTGEKPHVCPVPNCGHRSSQRGNLKTHIRVHTREKPYSCELCGKRFAQLGNLSAHKQIHNNTKKFVCVLGNCDKKFGTRGNLKNHQNRFHIEEIEFLTEKWSSVPLDTLSREERELLEYFTELYKYSNKGIKGRGSNRNYLKNAKGSHIVNIPSHRPPQHGPEAHQVPQPVPLSPQDGLPYHSNLTHYDITRNLQNSYEVNMRFGPGEYLLQ
ncbi:hypothetical protein F4779DRAFT_163098 [Xylariaceae sp. FL0662B]|nr:hypothetical protein F4779DRAFT_163098 [Xylariaceae sp. FL0662B]